MYIKPKQCATLHYILGTARGTNRTTNANILVASEYLIQVQYTFCMFEMENSSQAITKIAIVMRELVL